MIRVAPTPVVVQTPKGPVEGVRIAQARDDREVCLSVLVSTGGGPVLAQPDEVQPRRPGAGSDRRWEPR